MNVDRPLKLRAEFVRACAMHVLFIASYCSVLNAMKYYAFIPLPTRKQCEIL